MVRKAQAVGLAAEAPAYRDLTYAAVKRTVGYVRDARIGERAARDFVRAEPGDTTLMAERLREIDALLEESPLPASERRRVLEILDFRYSRNERTPDEVAARLHFLALVIGDLAGAYNDIGIRRWFERTRTALDGRAPRAMLRSSWKPEDPGPRAVRALARALTASPAT